MSPAILHCLARSLVFEATNAKWIRREYGRLFRPIDLELIGLDSTAFNEEAGVPALPEVELVIFWAVSARIPAASVSYYRPAVISMALSRLSQRSQYQLAEIFMEHYPCRYSTT